VHTIKDTLRVPPEFFDKELNGVATELLRKRYERTMDRELGILLSVFNVREIKDGVIYPGDPATHHDVTFDVLAFNLEIDEVFFGIVSEIMEFGCFVRIGPIDGLVHLSQITNDFMSYDRKAGTFSSRNTPKTVKKGDMVYAKVSTISMKGNVKDTKIALTMRPEGLGKQEWLLNERKMSGTGGKRGAFRKGGGRGRR
jgi:DNA-directed RNA polymerase subunit E'